MQIQSRRRSIRAGMIRSSRKMAGDITCFTKVRYGGDAVLARALGMEHARSVLRACMQAHENRPGA
jgi:hypothetical protein